MTLDPNNLPSSVKTLANLIGTEEAIALSKYAKHRHIYIPKTFNPEGSLTEVIGRHAAFILWKEYRGKLITVTTCNSVKAQQLRVQVNADILWDYQSGLPVREHQKALRDRLHALVCLTPATAPTVHTFHFATCVIECLSFGAGWVKGAMPPIRCCGAPGYKRRPYSRAASA